MDLHAVVSSDKFRPLGDRIFAELLPVAVSDSIVMLSHVAGSTGRILKWQNGLLKPGTTIIFDKEQAIMPELDRPWDSHTVVILFEDAIYGYLFNSSLGSMPPKETFIPFGDHLAVTAEETQYSFVDIHGVWNMETCKRGHRFKLETYSHRIRKHVPFGTTHLWAKPADCTKIRLNSTEFLVIKYDDVLLWENPVSLP